MANATTTEKTTTITTKTVELTLTEAEAETLRILTGAVSGDRENSRRVHTEGIYNALHKAGIAIDPFYSLRQREGSLSFVEDAEFNIPLAARAS